MDTNYNQMKLELEELKSTVAIYQKQFLNISLWKEPQDFIDEFLDCRTDEIEDFINELIKEYREEEEEEQKPIDITETPKPPSDHSLVVFFLPIG